MASEAGQAPAVMAPSETHAAEAVPEIAACLASARDIWVFAYGSLMWEPGFAHAEAMPALLKGYHRRFCLYSHQYRGTPERPGLVLGLDRGGACKGVAYRIPPQDAEAALRYLWEREMPGRTYRLKEVWVRLPRDRVRAFAFIVDRLHPQYTGELSLEETARFILQGVGRRGHCRQYLENTVRRLERLGVVDGPLHRLEQRVKELAAQHPPCL
jgi:cation transport protein ChaC